MLCRLSESFEECMSRAKRVLARGGLIVYPTDTLYGIGANALDAEAVERVFLLKRREAKPISILVHGLADIEKYCVVGGWQREFLQKILPGPYTVVLVKKVEFPQRISTTEKIGVRVPDHFFARALSKELGFPITSTSANLSGKKAPVSAEEIEAEIASGVELVIDGGRTAHARESTVIDLSGEKPVVLRKGAGYDELAGMTTHV
ncbi:MAG: L-threonylcarbamoyladenylate synthase [Candidatus Micrarchaeia archaeon]